MAMAAARLLVLCAYIASGFCAPQRSEDAHRPVQPKQHHNTKSMTKK